MSRYLIEAIEAFVELEPPQDKGGIIMAWYQGYFEACKDHEKKKGKK